MIRFRIGQQWKREPASAPTDSVGLELHGVNLLSGAMEEPLGEVVPALVGAVASLRSAAGGLAQVSFPEAHLELVLRREGAEVQLQVASLARPARLLRSPVEVGLEELATAAGELGTTFFAEARALEPGLIPPKRMKGLAAALKQLGRADRFTRSEPASSAAHRVAAGEPPSFGFELRDPRGVLRRYERDHGPSLGTLLCDGEVWLDVPGRPRVWSAAGAPFLRLLELSRQAAELARSVELGEARHAFAPAGVAPELSLDLTSKQLEVGPSLRAPLDPLALAGAMFAAGLSFTLAVTEGARAQAANPYLEELTQRCREGMGHLRSGTQPPLGGGEARERSGGARAVSKPLPAPGRLRRLRFEKLWEQRGLAGASEGARLLLQPQGPVYSAPGLACAFAHKDGAVLWRRAASHGVAATADGYVLAADADRVYGFAGRGSGARWLHDHDGLPLGPSLQRKEGLLFTLSEGRTVLAFAEATGRELWRLAPPRTQRCHVTLQGHRALLATDSGYLYGLDLADGQVRYRMRAALPFHGAPVPWGKRFVATLGRGEQVAYLLADAHSGQAVWTRELSLARPTAPLPSGSQLYVAGEREGAAFLGCLSAKGQTRWETRLHLGPGPFALAPHQRNVLASGASGAATRMTAEGRVSWQLGAAGEPLAAPIAPVAARGVLFLAGETVRAVDPQGGQVLAEVRAGPGLVSLQADAQLNLFFLDEAGTLSAYRLVTHFAVVAPR